MIRPYRRHEGGAELGAAALSTGSLAAFPCGVAANESDLTAEEERPQEKSRSELCFLQKATMKIFRKNKNGDNGDHLSNGYSAPRIMPKLTGVNSSVLVEISTGRY